LQACLGVQRRTLSRARSAFCLDFPCASSQPGPLVCVLASLALLWPRHKPMAQFNIQPVCSRAAVYCRLPESPGALQPRPQPLQRLAQTRPRCHRTIRTLYAWRRCLEKVCVYCKCVFCMCVRHCICGLSWPIFPAAWPRTVACCVHTAYTAYWHWVCGSVMEHTCA